MSTDNYYSNDYYDGWNGGYDYSDSNYSSNWWDYNYWNNYYYYYYQYQSVDDYFSSDYGNLVVLQNELYTNVSTAARTYASLRPSMPTNVNVYYAIIKTLSLSNSGVLSTTALLLLQWLDPRLSWNNTEYSCNVLTLPINNMWYPSLMLLNAASSSQTITPGSLPTATVRYNGYVSLYILRQYDSTCTLNLMNFPFDSQICRLQIISLDTNTTSPGVNFTAGVNMAPYRFYSQTGEFQLTNYTLDTDASTCFQSSCFATIKVTLYYTRRSSYYVTTVIIPLGILTALLALALIIPSENSIKISVACTLMISLYTLQQTVARLLPATEVAPLLSVGMAASLCLSSFCAFGTIMTVVIKMLQPNIGQSCLKCLHSIYNFCSNNYPASNKVFTIEVIHDKVQNNNNSLLGQSDFGPCMDIEPSSNLERLIYQQNKMMQEMLNVTLEQSRSAKEADRKRFREIDQSRGWRIMDLFMNIVLMVVYVVAAATCLALFGGGTGS